MFGLAVAVVSIMMRMSARFFIAGGFITNIGSDDICILIALVLICGISACAFQRKHSQTLEVLELWLTSSSFRQRPWKRYLDCPAQLNHDTSTRSYSTVAQGHDTD
jgi:hypothetical protein